jgi:hypothetical protein
MGPSLTWPAVIRQRPRRKAPAVVLAFAAGLAFAPGPRARAQGAACDAPDPHEARAVYACLQSGDLQSRGFAMDRMSCERARAYYLSLLKKAGLTSNRGQQYLPSCDMLARVSLDATGRAPVWQHCLGYPGGFNPDHFIGCIGKASRAADCQTLIERYRRGLMAANRFGQLPADYHEPDCGLIAAAIAAPEPGLPTGKAGQPPPEWAKCLKYDPADVTGHMKRCLGPDYTSFTSCNAVQRAYERALRAAYGGGLPNAYVTPACGQAAMIEKLGSDQIEQRREAAERARLLTARVEEARRRAAQQAASPSSGSGVFWRTLGYTALVLFGIFLAVSTLGYIVARIRRRGPS